MDKEPQTVMALDVGSQRIGVAIARAETSLARPLTTLTHTDTVMDDIKQLISDHSIDVIVVGLPRGLDGQTTKQTNETLLFVDKLKDCVQQPIYQQDEAVTSKQAETELQSLGKPYQKSDVDALAATYILEDFLNEQRVTKI